MSPKKILVVDDEEEVLTFVGNILKRANYGVISTTRGKEAVELAKNQLPDMIILDIKMPDMRGSEVAVLLSENSSTANIPIVFLTGILDKKKEESLEKIPDKPHYVMIKPTTGEELLEAINKVLSG